VYFVIQQWSQGFAYTVPIDPWIFISGGLAVITISLAIVGLNASKVALENPVKSLRSE
jgi:putative ABC transport system permease protein